MQGSNAPAAALLAAGGKRMGSAPSGVATVPLPRGLKLSPFPDFRWRRYRRSGRLRACEAALQYSSPMRQLSSGALAGSSVVAGERELPLRSPLSACYWVTAPCRGAVVAREAGRDEQQGN